MHAQTFLFRFYLMHKHMKDGEINKAREQTSERPDMNFNWYLFTRAMFIVVCYGWSVYMMCVKHLSFLLKSNIEKAHKSTGWGGGGGGGGSQLLFRHHKRGTTEKNEVMRKKCIFCCLSFEESKSMSAWLWEKRFFLYFSRAVVFRIPQKWTTHPPPHAHTLILTHTSKISGLKAKKLSTNYQKHREALINYSHEH